MAFGMGLSGIRAKISNAIPRGNSGFGNRGRGRGFSARSDNRGNGFGFGRNFLFDGPPGLGRQSFRDKRQRNNKPEPTHPPVQQAPPAAPPAVFILDPSMLNPAFFNPALFNGGAPQPGILPGTAATAPPDPLAGLTPDQSQLLNNLFSSAPLQPSRPIGGLTSELAGQVTGVPPINPFFGGISNVGTLPDNTVPPSGIGTGPTTIIDMNVLDSLRLGDTAGFIRNLGGNIQQNLNSATGLFLQLTA